MREDGDNSDFQHGKARGWHTSAEIMHESARKGECFGIKMVPS